MSRIGKKFVVKRQNVVLLGIVELDKLGKKS